MTPSEFDCQPESIVGPLPMESLRQHESASTCDFPHLRYDPAYVSYQQENHGGIPKKQWFRALGGTVLRLGRFVNFGGPYSEPYQDSWEHPGTDIRKTWSIGHLEGIANIADGCGAFLIPFGILYGGPHHPDNMQTTHSDLVCFDYSDPNRQLPTVVAWFNDDAVSEYYDCERDGRDSWTQLNHEKFTKGVAESFETFLAGLCETEQELNAKPK